MNHLHRKNIVHRDIKLVNILVGNFSDSEIQIKIADLGLATIIEN